MTSSRRALSSAAQSRTRGSDPGSSRTRTQRVSTGPRVRRMALPLESVPIRPADMERARAASLELAQRISTEVGLPVFLYGEVGAGRGPAFFRRGGCDELQQRIDAGELAPEFGPSRLDPAAGGVIVGARRPLIAFNVNLVGAN